MPKRSKAPCQILEGTWWRPNEVPQILPYFQAVSATLAPLDLGHRSIRSADDIRYWIKKLRKGGRAFVYLACHGDDLVLYPGGLRDGVSREDLVEALSEAKTGAIGFLHIGACSSIDLNRRRSCLRDLQNASGARLVSGYSDYADWLRSTLLDVALVAEVYVPYFNDARYSHPQLARRLRAFFDSYEPLVREMGLSALSTDSAGAGTLLPERLR